MRRRQGGVEANVDEHHGARALPTRRQQQAGLEAAECHGDVGVDDRVGIGDGAAIGVDPRRDVDRNDECPTIGREVDELGGQWAQGPRAADPDDGIEYEVCVGEQV